MSLPFPFPPSLIKLWAGFTNLPSLSIRLTSNYDAIGRKEENDRRPHRFPEFILGNDVDGGSVDSRRRRLKLSPRKLLNVYGRWWIFPRNRESRKINRRENKRNKRNPSQPSSPSGFDGEFDKKFRIDKERERERDIGRIRATVCLFKPGLSKALCNSETRSGSNLEPVVQRVSRSWRDETTNLLLLRVIYYTLLISHKRRHLLSASYNSYESSDRFVGEKKKNIESSRSLSTSRSFDSILSEYPLLSYD